MCRPTRPHADTPAPQPYTPKPPPPTLTPTVICAVSTEGGESESFCGPHGSNMPFALYGVPDQRDVIQLFPHRAIHEHFVVPVKLFLRRLDEPGRHRLGIQGADQLGESRLQRPVLRFDGFLRLGHGRRTARRRFRRLVRCAAKARAAQVAGLGPASGSRAPLTGHSESDITKSE